jgi:hypothetical protein
MQIWTLTLTGNKDMDMGTSTGWHRHENGHEQGIGHGRNIGEPKSTARNDNWESKLFAVVHSGESILRNRLIGKVVTPLIVPSRRYCNYLYFFAKTFRRHLIWRVYTPCIVPYGVPPIFYTTESLVKNEAKIIHACLALYGKKVFEVSQIWVA